MRVAPSLKSQRLFLLALAAAGYIVSCKAAEPAINNKYNIDIVFDNFTNDHVKLYVDGKLIVNRPMSIEKGSETTGLAYSQKVKLNRCSRFDIQARRFHIVKTVCVDHHVESIFIGGGRFKPRIAVSHGETGLD